MQAGVGEFLQRIIHKAVLRHAALSGEGGATNAHAEMGTETQSVGTRMARVGGTFVEHFQLGGGKHFAQSGFDGWRWARWLRS